MTIKNPDLRRALKGMMDDEVLIPILHATLNDPNFTGFQIDIEPWTDRPFDGYFHPSTQSTWNARQLALYLIGSRLFQGERMPLTGVFAITQGHFWHMFIQHVLGEQGVMVEAEIGFVDELHKRKGHMDGLLAIKGEREGLEIKSMNSRTIKKMVDEAALKELKFGYWSQAQEYLDVFDLPRMRFLFLCPDYPFIMKEFVVKADLVHQGRRRKIYRQAIEVAEEEDYLPMKSTQLNCCGAPASCPAKLACRFEG